MSAQFQIVTDGRDVTAMGTCTVSDLAYVVSVPLAQYKAWQSGALIQRAMPQLNEDQREFFLTGTTPQEWAAMFPPDDEEEKGDDTCQ